MGFSSAAAMGAFDLARVPLAIATLAFVGLVVWGVWRARRRSDLFLRPLEAIQYMGRAIGCAAETGKPVFFLPGMSPVSEASTISAIGILDHAARSAARHRVTLTVPAADPVVQAIARDVLDEASMVLGRPAPGEAAAPFLSNRPFAYAAGVVGLLGRERPQAMIYAGTFFAEAMILTESGALAGVMQAAATDSVTQAPFFVATCDRVLVGEELYAAGACLSRDPAQIGTIRAQDAAKAILVGLVLVGLIGSISGWFDLAPLLGGM